MSLRAARRRLAPMDRLPDLISTHRCALMDVEQSYNREVAGKRLSVHDFPARHSRGYLFGFMSHNSDGGEGGIRTPVTLLG